MSEPGYEWFPKQLGFDFLPWATPLLSIKDKRYKVVYGGRSSSKTKNVAIALFTIAYFKPVRIAAIRQYTASLNKSVILVFKDLVSQSRVAGDWKVYRHGIYNKRNGSEIFGHGLSERTLETVKGLEGVNYAWIEEAQTVTDNTWEYLDPTIRLPGSEIWITMNPLERLQPIYRNFVIHTNELAWTRQVNYNENPYISEDLLKVIEKDKEERPHLFAWKWLGEPDDSGTNMKVIPYGHLRECVNLYEMRDKIKTDDVHIGMDIADEGGNFTAITIRNGPAIDEVYQYRVDTLQAADIAFKHVQENSAKSLTIDAGPIGAGTRSALEKKPKFNYNLYPVFFGGKVQRPNSFIAKGIKHGDSFL